MFTISPEKNFFIQPFFQRIQRFKNKRLVGSKKYLGIITHTFKQADVIKLYKPATFTIFYKYLVILRQYAVVEIFSFGPCFFVF